MDQLRFALALFSTSIKSSISLRSAFLLQLCFMALNNLLVFVTWWILFERYEHIRGYRLTDMMAMFGVAATGFGVGVVLFGGAAELSRKIVDGDLDALLSQPKSVLLRALGARSTASGWGDIASGILLLTMSGQLTLSSIPAALLATLLSATVLTSSAVLMHSSAFWLGNVETAARTAHDFVIAFTVYPPTLFGPALKLVLFTILPAGLIAYLPVDLVRDFHWQTALLAVAGSAAHVAVSGWLFHRGLRRYASGSRFSTAS